MDGGTSSKSEEEIDQLRADLLASRMETERERENLRSMERALLDTRRELKEARQEICELWGDDEAEPLFDDGLESDVRRGY